MGTPRLLSLAAASLVQIQLFWGLLWHPGQCSAAWMDPKCDVVVDENTEGLGHRGPAKITTVPWGTGKELGEEGCHGHLGAHWHICHPTGGSLQHRGSLGCAEDAGGGKGFIRASRTAGRELLHPCLVSPCCGCPHGLAVGSSLLRMAPAFSNESTNETVLFSLIFLSGQIPAAACLCTFTPILSI